MVNQIFPNIFPPKRSATVQERQSTEDFFWDPAGNKISKNSYRSGRTRLEEKFSKYQENPRLPLRNLILLSLPVFSLGGALFFYPSILKLLFTGEGGGAYILILPVLPLIYYVYKIFNLQRDLIKLMIAKEHDWIYSPQESSGRWACLARKFPEFFRQGDQGQNLSDEFWGKFNSQKQMVYFWSGIFTYQKVFRAAKGKKRTTTYRQNALAIKLNKKIKADFRLVSENIFLSFLNFFRKKEIDTESAEFNKSFAVFYAGRKMENELDIIKVLSPAVQVKLLQLKNDEGKYSVLFRGEVAIFLFSGRLLKRMRANFFRKVELDPRDQEKLNKKINVILEITSGIAPYLD